MKQAYNYNTAIQMFTLLTETTHNFFFTHSALNKLNLQHYSTFNRANRLHGQNKFLSIHKLAKFLNMGMNMKLYKSNYPSSLFIAA
jgi:hypothetical protein